MKIMRVNPPKPPPTYKVIKDNRVAIFEFAREHGLPLPMQSDRFKFKELGCGDYGCVIETKNSSIVFKVTSDPTEAEFVQLAEPFGWPDGIVRYYGILQLQSVHQKRNVFVLWRESAFNVGLDFFELAMRKDTKEAEGLVRFSTRLMEFKDHAARLRDTLKKSKNPGRLWAEAKKLENWAFQSIGPEVAESQSGYSPSYPWFDDKRGAYRVAASLRACEIIAEMMENEYPADAVGRAFSFYLEKGIVLADVHMGNVGQVAREGGRSTPWVITDPGHAIVLG